MTEDAELREVVGDLEHEVDDLMRRVEQLERALESIRAVGEEFWRKEAAIYLLGLQATSWVWDAGDPNNVFADMYQAETLADGTTHRWLGKSGEVAATVSISRAKPLKLQVEAVYFTSPQLAESLVLEIEGKQVRWSARDGTRWTANVPERPSETQLNFRLAVDKKILPEGKDVSFSLAQICIGPVDAKKGSSRAAGDERSTDWTHGNGSGTLTGTP